MKFQCHFGWESNSRIWTEAKMASSNGYNPRNFVGLRTDSKSHNFGRPIQE